MSKPFNVGSYALFEAHYFHQLLEALKQRGYIPIGPSLREGELVYRELAGLDDLPVGWVDDQEPGAFRLARRGDQAYFGCGVGQHSVKKFLFPAVVRLWEARRAGGSWEILPSQPETPPYAFLGVRACDLAGLEVHDRVLSRGWYADPIYGERRRRAFIVAVHCTRSGGTCFCASLGTGPRAAAGFDLALTEVLSDGQHYFLVEVGTKEGADVLAALPHRPATGAEVAAAVGLVEGAARSQTRVLDTAGLQDFLYNNFDNPHWDQVAERCLSCGNCALVCPTCFCHSIQDSLDVTGQVAERWRRLDVCFTVDHSYIHGGAIRPSVRARYRQWLTHKLATWIDQFGCLGCVGCGRCLTWCPVGIDLTQEVQALRVAAAGEKEHGDH